MYQSYPYCFMEYLQSNLRAPSSLKITMLSSHWLRRGWVGFKKIFWDTTIMASWCFKKQIKMKPFSLLYNTPRLDEYRLGLSFGNLFILSSEFKPNRCFALVAQIHLVSELKRFLWNLFLYFMVDTYFLIVNGIQVVVRMLLSKHRFELSSFFNRIYNIFLLL